MGKNFDFFVANNIAYLEAMVDAYLEAAWWADSPEKYAHSYKEATKATRAAALADCKIWCQAALALGLNLTHASRPNLITADEAGHNLWLSRQGHGTGFWDNNPSGRPSSNGRAHRVWDNATAEKAHSIAKGMGERYLYVINSRFAIE